MDYVSRGVTLFANGSLCLQADKVDRFKQRILRREGGEGGLTRLGCKNSHSVEAASCLK